MEWRYIPPFSAPGSVQMAVDSWLFEQHRLGLHPPTLRFYAWEPVTVSLGRFQKRWPEHWSSLTWEGRPLKLVRRPSGGRAVLHHGDLTYCIVTTMEGYSRREAYKYLCQFLIDGWAKLGKQLQFGTAGKGYHQETNCFRLATGADLVDESGQKFIGSAQLWRGSTVLQHGSMAIAPDSGLQALIFGDGEVTQGSELELATIIKSLTKAAENKLGIQFHAKSIADTDWEHISLCGKANNQASLNQC